MSDPMQTQGLFSWFELMSDNPQSAKDFYGELIGWKFQTDSNNPDYTLVMVDGIDNPVAGIMDKNVAMGEAGQTVPSHWGSYITVKDVDAAAAKVNQLGGTLLVPPTDIPKVGRFCLLQDPQGAVISLMEYHLEV